MASWRAACCALMGSREAIAVMSHRSPRCMAGMTFWTAILATPSTPQRSLGMWNRFSSLVETHRQECLFYNLNMTARVVMLGLLATAAAMAAPTFTKDVAPIFFEHCAGCHRPNDIAPMSLLDYKSARPWAKSIREAVLSRKMPPWFADPHYGAFSNDSRLSARDVSTIEAWVEAGAPEGNPRD